MWYLSYYRYGAGGKLWLVPAILSPYGSTILVELVVV